MNVRKGPFVSYFSVLVSSVRSVAQADHRESTQKSAVFPQAFFLMSEVASFTYVALEAVSEIVF